VVVGCGCVCYVAGCDALDVIGGDGGCVGGAGRGMARGLLIV